MGLGVDRSAPWSDLERCRIDEGWRRSPSLRGRRFIRAREPRRWKLYGGVGEGAAAGEASTTKPGNVAARTYPFFS